MATRMQQRRGTAEQWTTVNPVLAEGEIGLETDTNKFKIGNGVTAWATLAYASLSTSDLADYATTTYVDNAINAVVGLAPETLDTLAELATALGDDPNAITTIQSDVTTLQTDVAGKADSTHSHTLADVTDVTATATEVNYVSGVTSSVQTQLDAKLETTDLAGYATETYADQAEADAVTTAAADATAKANAAQSAAELYADGLAVNYDSVGSADAAEAAANAYTDSLIGDITVDGTTGNTVTDRIATAVAGIVDSAPGTLDTLNELAAALNDDANFAATVTDAIAAKADAVHTHTTSDITDFDITSPADGSFLKYNSTTSKWEDAIIINGGDA